MTENHPFDVRLVYLAIHHILKHRGHFLFENFQTDEKGTSGFDESFAAFGSALDRIRGSSPDVRKADSMKDILKDKKLGVKEKAASLLQCLGQGKEKDFKAMMTLAAGGTASPSDIFNDEKLKDFEKNKVNFSSAQFEENEPDIMAELGDRYDLIAALHGLYNWSLLAELMGEYHYISEAKIAVYDKHKADLKVLKGYLSSVRISMQRFSGNRAAVPIKITAPMWEYAKLRGKKRLLRNAAMRISQKH